MTGPTLLQHFVSSRWRFSGLIVLLGLFFAQAVAASPYHSVTFDEQYHITPGYVYLKTGDLRFHHDQNPPLFEAILSAPLLLRSDIHLPIDHPAYQLWSDVYLFSDAFLWHANNDAQSLVQTGRIMAAIAGMLLGLLLFVWGRQLYGEIAGWIAVFLFVFDPNFIANAIPTLDLGLALTSTLAVFCLWHYLKRPKALTVVFAGLALGFALATKFLSVMLIPSFVLILLIYPSPSVVSLQSSALSPQPSALLKRFLAFLGMVLIAWGVLWATYRFQFGPINGVGLPVPAPQYFESFIGMFFKSSEGRANYLLGQVSTTGWPYYFVVAFLIKTPIPTLIAIFFAFIRWPWRREWRTTSVLILPALFFFGGASLSQLQLGYRYLLPVLPFLFLMAGRAVQDVILSDAEHLSPARKRLRTATQVGMAVLAIWLVIGAVAIYPNHLSYFNEAAGGPANGYRYLVDSNVDWGQDLPALKDWIDTHQPDRLHLGFFGSAYPDRYSISATGIPGYPNSAYGTEADAFTSYSLEPGQYALSATLLRIGLVARLFNAYKAFESMTPVDQVAHSILIYDVKYPDNAEIDRAVIVGPPASEVRPDALGYRANHPLRAKWCQPDECFIFTPHPARYVVRRFIPFAPDLAEQSENMARVMDSVQGLNDDRVYELDATSILQNKLNQLRLAPVAAPGGLTTTLPITFDNGLALAGYEVRQTQPHNLEVNTYWRVTGPITPPVTIFVHVLDKDGKIRGQNDSFGAATRMLEPGDIIVQHHPINIDAGAPPGTYRLEVGLYNPDTLDRFKAHPADMAETDHLLLSTVEINP